MLGKSGSDPDLQIIFKKRGQTPKFKKTVNPDQLLQFASSTFNLQKPSIFIIIHT